MVAVVGGGMAVLRTSVGRVFISISALGRVPSMVTLYRRGDVLWRDVDEEEEEDEDELGCGRWRG